MLLQVSLALVITYQMLTFADFDAVALGFCSILFLFQGKFRTFVPRLNDS